MHPAAKWSLGLLVVMLVVTRRLTRLLLLVVLLYTNVLSPVTLWDQTENGVCLRNLGGDAPRRWAAQFAVVTTAQGTSGGSVPGV